MQSTKRYIHSGKRTPLGKGGKGGALSSGLAPQASVVKSRRLDLPRLHRFPTKIAAKIICPTSLFRRLTSARPAGTSFSPVYCVVQTSRENRTRKSTRALRSREISAATVHFRDRIDTRTRASDNFSTGTLWKWRADSSPIRCRRPVVRNRFDFEFAIVRRA